METIRGINVEAYAYLQAIPPAHWSRHAFGSSLKSGMLLNNCCESFNNVLKHEREKRILQLMEWIRCYVMQRCCTKTEGLKKFDGVVMPSVGKMIHKGLEVVSNIRVHQADLVEFKVENDHETYVINLESKQCNCYRWELMGIPCWHALACIQKLGFNYEDYVHPAYHIQTKAVAYAPGFRGMPGSQQWEVTSFPQPKPHVHRVMPGRPSKKIRKKEVSEDKERKHVKRMKKKNKCSRCGGLCYCKTKCTNPVAPLPTPTATKLSKTKIIAATKSTLPKNAAATNSSKSKTKKRERGKKE